MITLSVAGSVLSASSENWFIFWVGMEISTISFITIIASDQGFTINVSAWNYFIFQGVGSALLFIPLIFFQSSIPSSVFLVSMVVGASLKLGLFPFHGWVIHVMENMGLVALFLLGSVQKIAPLVAIFSQSGSSDFLVLLLLTAFWASLSCVRPLSVNQILALSSILISSWLGVSLLSQGVFVLFYGVYSFHLLIFLLSIGSYPFHGSVSALYTPSGSVGTVVKGLALGAFVGLPPFGIFLIKLEVSSILIDDILYPVLFMIVSSSLMLFAYLKILIPMILSNGWVGYWSSLDFLLSLSLLFPILLLM